MYYVIYQLGILSNSGDSKADQYKTREEALARVDELLRYSTYIKVTIEFKQI